MIISFHKGFIFASLFLKALREHLTNKKCNHRICDQELTPNISDHANTVDNTNKKRAGEAEFEADVGLRFYPPVYIQRYLAVQDILADDKWKGTLKKVIDFGCAELAFFSYLKHISGIEEVLSVDIDQQLLENHRCRVAPLTSDYLSNRPRPLKVQVFMGSIAKLDQCLLGTDAVVCIEIIEHLWPEEVESVPYTVFGFIKPKLAVFTTPNSDFNILFPNFSGFRHFDHKFEWTREQFKCWAFNITSRYPDYDVTIDGIGSGPPGTEAYGHCSQMAVFVKRSPSLKNSTENNLIDQPDSTFKLLFEYDYPFREDKRTKKEKICQEAEYNIRMYGTVDEYCNDEGIIEIPLSLLMPHVEQWCDSPAMLMSILRENGWEMSGGNTESPAVVFPWYDGHSDTSLPEEEDEANENAATILADDSGETECPCEDWGLDENVATSSSLCQNDLDPPSNIFCTHSQENPAGSVEDCTNSLHNINDSHKIIASNLPELNELYKGNSHELSISEEKIPATEDPVQEYILSDMQVFQTKEKTPCDIETLVQTYPNGESAGFTLNGKALTWTHATSDETIDSDDHETPSVSGEWGMSSPELFSCTSMASQEGTFCSAVTHDASDPDSDQDMDLSVEREPADSDDSDSSQDAPIDNLQRVQQHRGNFPFGLNAVVENGDVANNNRDGEGNNAIAIDNDEDGGNFQLFEEEAGDHEVADGVEFDEEVDVLLPNDADPFPPWLLHLLNVVDEGEELGGAGEPQWSVNNG